MSLIFFQYFNPSTASFPYSFLISSQFLVLQIFSKLLFPFTSNLACFPSLFSQPLLMSTFIHILVAVSGCWASYLSSTFSLIHFLKPPTVTFAMSRVCIINVYICVLFLFNLLLLLCCLCLS